MVLVLRSFFLVFLKENSFFFPFHTGVGGMVSDLRGSDMIFSLCVSEGVFCLGTSVDSGFIAFNIVPAIITF